MKIDTLQHLHIQFIYTFRILSFRELGSTVLSGFDGFKSVKPDRDDFGAGLIRSLVNSTK